MWITAEARARYELRCGAHQRILAQGPVIITKNGRPVAALVAITDDDELERLVMAHTPRVRQLLDAAAERIKRDGGIPHGEFWQQVAEESEA
jgi:antitoxin (DNA-binding transcriptional repressor) of toxin-antitoxin stability system